MSIECLNQALKISGLTPTKKFILVILGNYADEKGSCYPSYRHLANIVGLKDTKGVQRAIKQFEEMGLLRIEHRKTNDGGNTSNRYHLTMAMGVETPACVETKKDRVTQPSNTKDNTKEYINEDFTILWSVYPRKIGKKMAHKIFCKYDEKHYKKILYGAQRFAEQNMGTDEKFIPHLSTWLNQERWMDWFVTDEHGYIIKPKEVKTKNNLAG